MHNDTPITAFGITHIGGRKNNEDAFKLYDHSVNLVGGSGRGELFCVADGMGGHRGGERASQIAVECLWDFFSQLRTVETDDDIPALLQTLFHEANDQILNEARRNSEYFNMGTTLTAAVVKPYPTSPNPSFAKSGTVTPTASLPLAKGESEGVVNRLFYAHVGDSRLYHLPAAGSSSGKSGGQCPPYNTLTQLTEDHTIAAELMRLKRITPEELRSHPERNTLFSYLGKEKGLTIQTGEIELQAGDRLLLCTDGLIEVLSDAEIDKMLASSETAQEICEELINAALSREPGDNLTAVVIC